MFSVATIAVAALMVFLLGILVGMEFEKLDREQRKLDRKLRALERGR